MWRHSRTGTFAHTGNPYPRCAERNRRRLAFETLEPRQMLAAFDVLVFGRTTGFRHSSIDEGLAAIQALGAANDFSVQYTENAGSFIAANLAPFEAIVFLNTTGDVLNATQQAVFENYIRAGGGFVGVHSAADTEYGWAWYGELLGAYFASHPAIQQATIEVADHAHISTAHLPERWVRTDEWYNYSLNPRGDVHVLMTLDESTYSPGAGAQGFDHPISWYHYFDGGRSWYTGLGHTEGTYLEPLFQQHLLGGILFAAGQAEADLGATVDANWRKVDLATSLNSPMSLDVAPDGRVFFVERGGAVKVYNPASGITSVAAQLNTYTGDEHGLLGIALDPDFETNHWIYLFWSLAGAASDQRLARFTVVGDQIDPASQKGLLTFHTDRGGTNHEAGSLAFGPDGNLYISTGDNTNPFESSGFNPIDERPGRFKFDAQRSAGNMNDLRGKILRIKPQPDGTYTIPAGNLFPADGSAGRPEIYVMGNRNPFRISIDAETGWLYWGEVGPDAGNDNAARGPRGYDEINQARQAGNYGWPYIIADNKPYRDFDFDTGISGALFNPAAPINNSPNNTGSMNLPPANPALIWYPYATSTQFPELGSGGRTAMAGPVYHFDDMSESRIKLPEYFDDTLIMYEWSRSQFFEVNLDQRGQLLKINRIFSELSFNRPIDVELGPDGALYVLEWGAQFGGGPDAKLVRVEFLGNRPSVTGDYNRNNTVDAADYVVWRKNLGSTTDLSADGNGDRMIDARDHAVWRANFGALLPSPGAAGSAAAATFGGSSIGVGESEMAGRAPEKSTSALVSSFTTLETSSTLRPSSRPSLALNRKEDIGRYRDDDLLLLATNRVWQSPRRDSFEPLDIRNSGDRVDDAPRQSVIDESLALAFELY
ncbi:MAG TPA: ThuA domain-containing protein [Lacipirellulaceae bacterium]|nr:ThuA domain-containing protein [Lacipirellulaceae bacterium]